MSETKPTFAEELADELANVREAYNFGYDEETNAINLSKRTAYWTLQSAVVREMRECLAQVHEPKLITDAEADALVDRIGAALKAYEQALLIGIRAIEKPDTAESLLREIIALETNPHGVWSNDHERLYARIRVFLERK